MNKLSIFIFIFVAAFGSDFTRASDLVQFPKGPAAWTVDVSPSPSSGGAQTAPDQRQLVKIDVTQDGQKRHAMLNYANGATAERFLISSTNYILVKHSNGIVTGLPNGGDYHSIYGVPFLESSFACLKPEFLVEKQPVHYRGKACYHYKGTVVEVETDFDPQSSGPHSKNAERVVEAWIDSTTLLPVAFDDGTNLGIYKFLPPPYPTIDIPPEYQATYNRLSH